jgi:hypothetical protein
VKISVTRTIGLAAAATLFAGMGGALAGPPPVQSSGLISVRQSFTVDFDKGSVGGAQANADFWFRADDPGHLYFATMNGATLSSPIRNKGPLPPPPGYVVCGSKTLPYSASPISFTPTLAGAYFCVRTNQGRLSEFQIERVVKSSGPKGVWTLGLRYTTWDN